MENEYFSPSALAMKRIGADGGLGAFGAVSPSGQYSSGSAGACVYEGMRVLEHKGILTHAEWEKKIKENVEVN